MGLEIERKFLVKHPPVWYEGFPYKEILQGYFNDPTTGKSVRVRKIGDEYKVTRKKGYGLIREEIEASVSKQEFDDFWRMVENHFLEKTRYYIPYEWHTIELDIYKNLQWLMTAEVEFKTKRDAKKFMKPDWFDEDLTMMREASNGYIANHGLSEELLWLLW